MLSFHFSIKREVDVKWIYIYIYIYIYLKEIRKFSALIIGE